MESNETRRVWGIGTPRTLRAHWTLAELGLDYETKALLPRGPEMQDHAFRALSERGKIPLLEDRGFVIGESAAIAIHLADRYREVAALTPTPGTDARIRHEELCFFIMTEMDAFLYVLRRHEGLSEIYGPSETACSAARASFTRSAREMERRLADARPYLLGDAFSIADLLLKTCLDWADFSRTAFPDSLRGYSQRIAKRPALGQAMAINFPPEAIAALAPPSTR